MKEVLFANALWLVFLSFWCILYFVQRRMDERAGAGRFPPYVAPND